MKRSRPIHKASHFLELLASVKEMDQILKGALMGRYLVVQPSKELISKNQIVSVDGKKNAARPAADQLPVASEPCYLSSCRQANCHHRCHTQPENKG